jgi:hypothetical protein
VDRAEYAQLRHAARSARRHPMRLKCLIYWWADWNRWLEPELLADIRKRNYIR